MNAKEIELARILDSQLRTVAPCKGRFWLCNSLGKARIRPFWGKSGFVGRFDYAENERLESCLGYNLAFVSTQLFTNLNLRNDF